MNNKTYCINKDCPFKDCDKHLSQLKIKEGMVNVANFDGVCDRYLFYILEIAMKEGENYDPSSSY